MMLFDELRNNLAWISDVDAQSTPVLTELSIKIYHSIREKMQSAIRFREIIKDTSVEDKDRKHFFGVLECMNESGVICEAEVLAESEESFHANLKNLKSFYGYIQSIYSYEL
jgi:hypothetical protein